MQVTVQFGSFPPQFCGRTLGDGQGPPTTLPLPPTTRENLRLNGYLEYPHSTKALHLQTSMSSPGFKPSPYGTTVSVTKHYTS
ncbi:hypothetical protein TNCV_4124001 [Trichonephila clavipes]|nr:hypothetical protein TNCV_4124001 [Trichonephila clavipes]